MSLLISISSNISYKLLMMISEKHKCGICNSLEITLVHGVIKGVFFTLDLNVSTLSDVQVFDINQILKVKWSIASHRHPWRGEWRNDLSGGR